MTCFYFICCLLDPSKKEGSSSFLRALTLPPATHSFTNLHYIPWQSACSQGHSPWKSAGFVFLVVILVLLSLISKDFLFTCLRSIRQQCSLLACSFAICQPSLKQNCNQIYFWQQGIFWPILLPAECLESFKLMATSKEKRKSKSHLFPQKETYFSSHFCIFYWLWLRKHFKMLQAPRISLSFYSVHVNTINWTSLFCVC